MTDYTLIRHSRYAAGGNPDYENAVEACELTRAQVYQVRAAGGVVFASREEAVRGEALANFPRGEARGPPDVPGYFSSLRIGGGEIYLPPAVDPP